MSIEATLIDFAEVPDAIAVIDRNPSNHNTTLPAPSIELAILSFFVRIEKEVLEFLGKNL
jgi:hypothetical protein